MEEDDSEDREGTRLPVQLSDVKIVQGRNRSVWRYVEKKAAMIFLLQSDFLCFLVTLYPT